jgi:transcriptional regulator with XRE-family HTH domain
MNRNPNESRAHLDHMERLRSVMTGQAVRQRRETKGWSQRQLAEFAGISRSEMQYIETAKRNPKSGTLGRVCDALGISYGELVTQVDRMLMEHLIKTASGPHL